jgi:hypothetical protein
MEILNQLSSQKSDKTEASNHIVAEKCIANPQLLAIYLLIRRLLPQRRKKL